MVEIITISLIAWYLSVGLGFIQWLKWRLKRTRLKPFDCPKCMGFWIGFIVGYSKGCEILPDLTYNILGAVFYGILCSTCSIIIEKGIARL